VRRANSTMSSTLPSFGLPAQVSSARLSLRSSKHAEDIDIRIVLEVERFDQFFAVLVGADDDGAAVEPAVARPAANHRAQEQPVRRSARRDQRRKERRQPERETSPPSLAKNEAPMNSRNHEGQAEIIRVICRS